MPQHSFQPAAHLYSQSYQSYDYTGSSTSAAAYYPTPDMPAVEAFDDRRAVSSSSVVDHGSPPLSPDPSQYLVELPDFTIAESSGSYSSAQAGPFPVTATPSDSGFATQAVDPRDLPPPVQTMTKEEWLRLGGFMDVPAPMLESSTMSRGLSTSMSSSLANWDRPCAGDYPSAPPPPQPYQGPPQHNQQVHHYAPADSYSRQGGRISFHPTCVRPPQNPTHRQHYDDHRQYDQPSGQMLPPPLPPAQFAFDWSNSSGPNIDSYGFPSPASSVPSPAQHRKATATSQSSSRRSQARNAPSPTIPARHRPAPYPTSADVPVDDSVPEDQPAGGVASASPTQVSPPAPASSPAPAAAATSTSQPSPASILPIPANSTRKSHSRKASANHIPRPRNAFILFRSSAVSTNMIPSALGLVDHKNISKVIGEIWRGLGAQERGVWERMAEVEKAEHARRYPGYVYKPKKREVREREREERKEAARAAKGRPPAGVPGQAGGPSVLDHVPEGWTSTVPEPLPLPAPASAVRWDDRRCRAVAMAVLEGEDERIVAKVEENLAAESSDDGRDEDAKGEADGGSSQETVKSRAEAPPVEHDANGDIPVTPAPRRSARTANKAAQAHISPAVATYTLPPLPQHTGVRSSPVAATDPSPPRPKLTSIQSSPANITTFPHASPSKSDTTTPTQLSRSTRRAQSVVEGHSAWPSPLSSTSSSSTASPSSAQRRHGLHTDRYELPTPTRPHPLTQSHPAPDNRLQKQQSFALAGLGIATPGTGPGAFARGASNWNGSLEPSGSFARLPSLSFQGGFDNSPLLGGGDWSERRSSLGRWDLRKASTHISKRELLAQQAEEEGGEDGDAHARASSGEEQPWNTAGTGYATFDPSAFLTALDDDTQSVAPSWDSVYELSPHDPSGASTAHSSQHQASSSSSYYQPSSSSRMGAQAAGASKGGSGRTPSFHLGGQEIFAAPVADAEALFGAPQGATEQGGGRSFSNLFGAAGSNA